MLQRIKLADLEFKDRPRERLILNGAASLTDAELLALVLRSGSEHNSVLDLSYSLLKEFGGIRGLASADLTQLMQIEDVGMAKATSIKAMCEISLRMAMTKSALAVKLSRPGDVFELMRKDLFGKQKEHLYLLSLDLKHRLLSKDLLSVGTLRETIVSRRELFRIALIKGAVSIVLVHNHPSLDPMPSAEDIEITHLVAAAGQTIGITLLDHVIVCDDTFCSVKALGILPAKGGD